MSQLFPDRSERLAFEDGLTRRIAEALDAINTGAAVPRLDLGAFRASLNAFDFDTPLPLEACCSFALDSLTRGIVPMTHPRYFGLFNPAPAYAAECADRIVSAFNPQLAVWSHAPAAVEIERHVAAAVARRLGLGESSGGHFTSGGSEANETALLCALVRSEPNYAEAGVTAFTKPPVFYISRESHLAWLKIAQRAGVGRNAVRKIATDGLGRMNASALRETVARDKAAGFAPVLIAATAGTTNAGMIDPLEEVAAVAREARAWFHVDAAWGGALCASPKKAAALAGVEAADSVTVDAHKWFAASAAAGMYLCRSPWRLNDLFHVSTSYMPSNDTNLDPYVTTALWSRRFVGLRLFMILASAGWRGVAEHVEHALALIGLLRQRLETCGWTIANASPLAVLNALPPSGAKPPAEIVRAVQDSGEAWVSVAQFEGKEVVRACITNGRTTESDVERLVEALVAAA